ncbi:VOC family protein [Virgibacillus sp. C22-A2]|uniref:VOC family protein n=1 Tax=Virgibacillus tibetensis TaxID=3042313 RepID=A0ABU6KER9_9BACI|nr:VOC family protein [Virgibacillus sp. C22-A2]
MTFTYEVIDHVQIAAPVGGEDKAREYYHEKLGFEEVEKPDLLKKNGGVWFQAGSVHIHIGLEDPFTPAEKAHPAIRVKDIGALKRHLDEVGVEYLADDRLPGADRFYAADPFGNRIEFLEWINE